MPSPIAKRIDTLAHSTKGIAEDRIWPVAHLGRCLKKRALENVAAQKGGGDVVAREFCPRENKHQMGKVSNLEMTLSASQRFLLLFLMGSL